MPVGVIRRAFCVPVTGHGVKHHSPYSGLDPEPRTAPGLRHKAGVQALCVTLSGAPQAGRAKAALIPARAPGLTRSLGATPLGSGTRPEHVTPRPHFWAPAQGRRTSWQPTMIGAKGMPPFRGGFPDALAAL